MAESASGCRKCENSLQIRILSDKPDVYQFGQLLYQGQFGKVGAIKEISTGKEFALKTISLDEVTECEFSLIMVELFMLMSVSHTNIIRPLTSWSQGPKMAIVLPLMVYGSCADICRKKFPNGISENAMGVILTHILPALVYLHEKRVIHRTIKGSKILINEHGVAILCGFKFAVNIEGKRDVIHRTNINHMTRCLNWMSPELLGQDRRGYKKNTDVYSLGITILELCNGVVPFADMTPTAMLVQKLKFGATKLWDKTQLPSTEGILSTSMEGYPSDSEDEDLSDFNVRMAATDRDAPYANKCYSKSFHHFTKLCLVADNQIRPDTSGLIKHKFLKAICDTGYSNLVSLLELNEPLHFQPTPDGHDESEELKESSSDVNVSWIFD